jgi:hypothetical protein
MLRILLVALLLAPNAVQALEPSDDTTQRLAVLGRVWGRGKHAHPEEGAGAGEGVITPREADSACPRPPRSLARRSG